MIYSINVEDWSGMEKFVEGMTTELARREDRRKKKKVKSLIFGSYLSTGLDLESTHVVLLESTRVGVDIELCSSQLQQ